MPGPVGGDYYNEAALANYTYMYMKSVENVLLKKSFTSDLNKSSVANDSKIPDEKLEVKTEKILKEKQTEEELKPNEEILRQVPKESETKEDSSGSESSDVFSTNYDNFFNKNINPAAVADIVKNISSKTNVLEKASENFPGKFISSNKI